MAPGEASATPGTGNGMTGIGIGGSILSTIFSASGAFGAANSAIAGGQASQQAMDYQAAQLTTEAGQVQANASNDATEKSYETSMLLSTVRARGAYAGGSGTDPGEVNILQQVAGRGMLNVQDAIYQGAVKSTGLKNQAAADIYQGQLDQMAAKEKAQGYQAQGIATIFSGMSSLYSKYAMGGSPTAPGGSTFVAGGGDGGWA